MKIILFQFTTLPGSKLILKIKREFMRNFFQRVGAPLFRIEIRDLLARLTVRDSLTRNSARRFRSMHLPSRMLLVLQDNPSGNQSSTFTMDRLIRCLIAREITGNQCTQAKNVPTLVRPRTKD